MQGLGPYQPRLMKIKYQIQKISSNSFGPTKKESLSKRMEPKTNYLKAMAITLLKFPIAPSIILVNCLCKESHSTRL
uniref:Uncharacterized protein n=1 Tax=Manihot esculenta TaxID=3983 RepID=A0A2C9UUF7_MANES